MARPTGSAELIEARRHQAPRLLDEGYSLGEVGRMSGCAASSVMRWRDTRQRGGDQALKVRATPGRPPSLSEAQRQRVIKKLVKGAMDNGFSTELWTTGRVATVIQRCCRIHFTAVTWLACCTSLASAAKSRNVGRWNVMKPASSSGSVRTGRG